MCIIISIMVNGMEYGNGNTHVLINVLPRLVGNGHSAQPPLVLLLPSLRVNLPLPAERIIKRYIFSKVQQPLNWYSYIMYSP